MALRARIVLWSAEGRRRKDIAELAGVAALTVDRCKALYAERSLAELEDKSRIGSQRHQVLHDQEGAQEVAVEQVACVVGSRLGERAGLLESVAEDGDSPFFPWGSAALAESSETKVSSLRTPAR